MSKKVLFLGASGLIGPHITPGLESHCDLHLADIKPHPDGVAVAHVDVTHYDEVHEAARDMDAIMNFTVVRGDSLQSFRVNTMGAWHVMRAAADLGITKVIHSGPQQVRRGYDWDFDIVDVPLSPNTGYYSCTKYLAGELCNTLARCHRIHTLSFVFNGLSAGPVESLKGEDIPPFRLHWEDLQHACRLALDVASVPGYYQELNMHSFDIQGKYSLAKARDILGYEPTQRWDTFYKRSV
ncbi:MAG: NAD(P)-dependent oxidoreductase [Candidatus Latescibacteria bacterium]|jgi:hypothetical protein|nr:NAD(P)-dependent oxidoreductase [Candidatus Latescibacterota bacterium]